MSLIPPIEQTAAEFLCGLIIPEGQNGVAANIAKRASSALAAAKILADIAGGNASAGLTAVTAALSDANLDPAMLLAVQNLVTLGFQQIALAQALTSVTPLFGSAVSGVLTNIAAGVTAAANAELAKYAPPAAA